jgi:hypothetical protein
MRRALAWALAVVLTLASAVYQRLTGPTNPVRGTAAVGAGEVRFRLPRSAANDRDCRVSVKVPDAAVTGHMLYRRFRTEDAWVRVDLERSGDRLAAALPRRPAATKVAYRVVLEAGGTAVSLAGETPVVIRFKGPVPPVLLAVHIAVMLAALLLASMAGITALDRKRDPRGLAAGAAASFVAGGFILGPLVQEAAFGVLWSGFPLGTDLTDNKTLVALIFWIVALVTGRKGRSARGWIVLAAAVTLIINLVPHSLFGSELKP